MSAPLQILLVEDSASDAKLIVSELSRMGRPIEVERVHAADTMRAALGSKARDVVVADWVIPGFGALAALEIVTELRLDLPFIIVSGVIGEDTAADAMRAGAHDYVLKDRLARLRPAIERELRDHAERVERRKAEAALEQMDAKYRALLLQKVEELNRSNEELAQFAYIASHDLQEPLRMVASYTQLLSRRYKGRLDTDADEFIGFAVDGVSRLQSLFQGLLEYSRVGTKGEALLETSSEDALEQATVHLHGAIEESGALVTHGPLPAVLADRVQLIELLQNLMSNAIKYHRPGVPPRVHVSSAKEDAGDRWRFSVQDNGLGIESRYFARIFGMFQRLHKRDEFTGIGIGLTICKKIAERHGSSVSVESELGQGSTFHFALAGAP
jgi:signal transduction histidine kinase